LARNPTTGNPLKRLFRPETPQAYFRALADKLNDSVLLINPQGTEFLGANHAFLLLSGYTRPEVDAMSPSDLFMGEPGARALANALGLPQGQEVEARDIPIQTRNDLTVLIDINATRVGADDGPILLIARPSLRRKQVEDQARAQSSRVETLVDISERLMEGAVGALTASLDLAQKMLRASKLGLYRVSPSSPDYVLEGSLSEAFPERLPAGSIKSFHRSGQWTLGQRPEHELHKAARAAGLAALRTSAIGSPNAWIGLLAAGWEEESDIPEDIEGLMRLVANLCHGAIQLSLQQASVAEIGRTLTGLQAETGGQLDAVTEAVLSLDGELRILRANKAACRMLGYSSVELLEQDVKDILVGPEDVVASLLDALGHERMAERPYITLHRRDGTPFPVHLRAMPLGRQSPTRLLVVLSDQTERKAIEDQNELLAQRALLGEVSAIFAHEVRNPINNISTGIQLVASRLGEEHPMHESLERVRKECTRLDQLMTDVLFFTRRLELKMEPVDLGDMLGRLMERWAPRLKQANVTSHLEFDPDARTVLADPRTFEQVIVNLITNALQAMPDGGTLSMTLAPAAPVHGEMVELKIADTGPGIPQETIDRIFDPFFTTKKDGTGLGLAISRRIIAAHKGSIQVESFPDAGTVFTLHIPPAETLEEAKTA
jgi:two-component system sensor histidine kinase AtoS